MASQKKPVLAKLRSICLALPEAYEEAAWVGTRWMIRKRNFAHLVEIAAGTNGSVTVLTFRAAGMLYDTLRTTGAPYFQPAWGTRWGTLLAPKKLASTIGSQRKRAVR